MNDKTKDLGRMQVSPALLHANPKNPNEMSDPEFNLLYDNIERVGLTDPILVRPHPDKEGEYRIIGGEHRWEVAKLMGFEEVPITVINDPDFSEDEEMFQLMRHNTISGKLSPSKFLDIYKNLSQKYTDEILAESFGFAEREQLDKLIKKTKASLPKEMQKKFEQAAKEIQSIDDLSSVLNRLFAEKGETLDQGFMVFDFGGKEHIWVRMRKGDRKAFDKLAEDLLGERKTMDGFMSEVMAYLTSAVGSTLKLSLMEKLTAVEETQAISSAATLDFLDD